MRLSTWFTLLAFIAIAAWRSERDPLVAAVTWLAGFEAAYQIAAMTLHTPKPIPVIGPISLSLLVGAPVVAAAMTLLGARANPWLLTAALLVFVIWVAAGFHVNDGTTVANIPGEALNDAAKTLWALAYLVPLLHLGTSSDETPHAVVADA